MSDKKYYSTKEIADMFDVHIKTVRNWINTGELDAYKPGKDFRISQEQLDEFLEDRKANKGGE